LDHLIWNENGRSFHICLLCTTLGIPSRIFFALGKSCSMM
jgi:hypothetical protein